MREQVHARNAFVALWALLLLVKIVLAAQLPLFVDEAFYWQEGQHLAWAYSDLPGLTAFFGVHIQVCDRPHLLSANRKHEHVPLGESSDKLSRGA